jgi:ATP synthase F1 gamma subunit
MAVGKEIRNKIKSVENTKKITKAMEMVAASKMRKAQDRMLAARPYADKVRNITANLAKANPEYVHPFMLPSAGGKKVGFIVVSTDKGLCGGLNTNVLRAVTNQLRELDGRVSRPTWLPSATRPRAFSTASAPMSSRTSSAWVTPPPGKAHWPGQGSARRLHRW